ncbi:MAG TPA: TlpA disulfide reductase family protein [Polyangiaceae bacterium]|nr:TlpA disulfide reductase family protein [Polyangiaceae bacterium]
MTWRGRAAALLAPLCALACGSNAPDVPEELLGGSSSCSAPGYPNSGTGTEKGDVVVNACFTGYRAPDRVSPTPEHRETISFSDYYDPAGTKGVSLLLINTAAFWCGACLAEHETLPDHARELAPQGLVVISAVFQDAHRDAATLEDVERWIANFHSNFPVVADPKLDLQRYSPPSMAPLNMVVDPRSMKILREYVGDQSSVMWPYIKSELAARSAQP